MNKFDKFCMHLGMFVFNIFAIVFVFTVGWQLVGVVNHWLS